MNTNGWELTDELSEWTKLEFFSSRTGLDLSRGDLADNLARGKELWRNLRDAIHAGQHADRDAEAKAVVWRKHAKKARRKLRKQFREDGLPDLFDAPDLDARELTAWITTGARPSWATDGTGAVGSTGD